MSSNDSSAPAPPKRPLWRRWWFVVSVLVLPLVGGYLVWDYTAERALQKEIARIRAAGEPVEPEDLKRPPVPPEQNAVVALEDARKGLKLTDEQRDLVGYASPALVEKYPRKFQEMVEANSVVLELLREARGRNDAHWGIHFSSPMLEVLLPPSGEHRQVARLARAAALSYHLQDRDDEALGTIRDVVQQANVIARAGTLISSLVSIAIHALAFETLEDCLPDMPMDDPGVRREAEELLAQLLDEQVGRGMLVRALYLERICVLDTFNCIRDGKFPLGDLWGVGTGRAILLTVRKHTPLHQTDCAWAVRQFTDYVEAAKQLDYPATVRKLPKADVDRDSFGHFLAYGVGSLVVGPLERVFQMHYNVLASRRMAATALAMRLFETDHGRRPEKLEELVPDYLEEIPEDPFTPDGSPIKLGEWGGQPVLYSFGKDGIDDGGRWAENPEQSRDSEEYDLVVFLNAYEPDAESQLEYVRRELNPDSERVPPADGALRRPGALTAPVTRPVGDETQTQPADADSPENP